MKNKNTTKPTIGTKSYKVIELLDKIEKINRFDNPDFNDKNFYFPDSSPTKGSTEVSLPLSYRQLSRIQ